MGTCTPWPPSVRDLQVRDTTRCGILLANSTVACLFMSQDPRAYSVLARTITEVRVLENLRECPFSFVLPVDIAHPTLEGLFTLHRHVKLATMYSELASLPYDIHYELAAYLDVRDVVNLHNVSRELRHLLEEESICQRVMKVWTYPIIWLSLLMMDSIIRALLWKPGVHLRQDTKQHSRESTNGNTLSPAVCQPL